MTVLNILGMGYAYPPSKLGNDFLASLNKALTKERLDSELGIAQRSSVLPLDYIRSSGNQDHKQGQLSALKSPSDLSWEASQMALSAAALGAEQLGLILAECATPVETTPFESQRLGKRLNVKIPAYDVYSGSGMLSLYLDLLSKKRPDTLADYILCASSNTPTQRVNYQSGSAAPYLGDAAAAFIVSSRHRGRLEIVGSAFQTDPFAIQPYAIDTYGSAQVDEEIIGGPLAEQFGASFHAAAKRFDLRAGSFKLIMNHPSPTAAQKLAKEWGVAGADLLESISQHGFSFGSGGACALAEYWPKIGAEDKILVLECAGNLGQGYVLFQGLS